MARVKKEENNEKEDLIKIKNELKDYINDEIREKVSKEVESCVSNKIDETIKKEFVEGIDKANKKVIFEKNKKIVTRDIIIILLLLLTGYLSFILYKEHYFDKFFSQKPEIEEHEETKKKEIPKKEEIPEEQGPTLEELKEKYASLLNPIQISELSIYVNDYYKGKLSNELRNYLTLNQINFKDLEIEEDYNVIQEEQLEKEHNKLFTAKYQSVNFSYNGNKIRFLNKMNSFITDSLLEQEESHIKREIINIVEDNETISITTVEGILKEGRLYNIIDGENIEGFDTESSILDYQTELTSIVYVFKDKKLVEIISNIREY